MSKYDKYLDKSTSLLLEEMAEEYKGTIIENVLLNERIDISEVRLKDLYEENKRLNNLMAKTARVNRHSKLILIMGIFYVYFGLFIFVFDYAMKLDTIAQIGVIFTLLGGAALFLSIVQKIMPSRAKDRSKPSESQSNDFAGVYITNWNILEMTLREITSALDNDVNHSFSKMLQIINERAILDKSDIRKLDSLLSIRNEVVHGRVANYNSKTYMDILNDLRDITNKLEVFSDSLNKY